jgi:signal transduction histidine kinase
MGINPPDLQRAGLATALSDLIAPLHDEGIGTTIDVPASIELPLETGSLLFRASQEAIRNVVTHAHAHQVSVTLTAGKERATLEVRDDGVGFSEDEGERARMNGHVGLELLGDLARDAGGTLDVSSTPGEGTVLRLEVPCR